MIETLMLRLYRCCRCSAPLLVQLTALGACDIPVREASSTIHRLFGFALRFLAKGGFHRRIPLALVPGSLPRSLSLVPVALSAAAFSSQQSAVLRIRRRYTHLAREECAPTPNSHAFLIGICCHTTWLTRHEQVDRLPTTWQRKERSGCEEQRSLLHDAIRREFEGELG
jgi:hypothetical protein